MPKYVIIFKPGSASDRANVDTEITADGYFAAGRFFRFYKGDRVPGDTSRTGTLISAADVLQIKEATD